MKNQKNKFFCLTMSFTFLLCFIIVIVIDSKLDSESKYSYLFRILEIAFPIFSFASSGVPFYFYLTINKVNAPSVNSGNTEINNFNGVDGTNKISKMPAKTNEGLVKASEENVDDKMILNDVSSIVTYKETQHIWDSLLGQKHWFMKRKMQRGYISKKAYDILQNKTTLDIELLSETFKAAFSSGEVCLDFCKLLDKEDFLMLTNWGLIKSELFRESISIGPQKEAVFVCGKLVFIIKNKSHDDSQNVNWDCYMLTREGTELQKALNETISFESAFNFCRNIVENNKLNQNLEFSVFDLLKLKRNPKTGIENPVYGKHNYLSLPSDN